MKAVSTFLKTMRRILRNLFIIFLVVLLLFVLGIYLLIYRGTRNYEIQYGDAITQAAEKEGLDPQLVAGVVKSESDFDPQVIASDGGVGLMQLMPDAVSFVSERLNLDPDSLDLQDPETNLMIGTHYLSYLMSRYQSEDLAIVAYNTGFSNVDQWLQEGTITWEYETMQNIPFEVPRRYVHRVNEAQETYEVFYGEGLPDETLSENQFLLAFQNLRHAILYFLQKNGF